MSSLERNMEVSLEVIANLRNGIFSSRHMAVA